MRFQFRDLKELLKDYIGLIIITILIIFIMTNILTIQQNIGPSMEPTMNSGDIVLLNRIKYKFADPKRYDVISFASKESKYMVKRIIGLPGEIVEYKDGILYINSKPVYDEYSKETEDFEFEEIYETVIKEDEFFVLGDNRKNSLDSRYFGLINKKDIIGSPLIRFWPLNKIKKIK